jgi:vitamin B12 transporter
LFAATRSRAFEFPGFTKASLVGGYRVWQNDRSALRFYTKIDNVFNQRYYQNGWLAAKAIAVVGLGYTY